MTARRIFHVKRPTPKHFENSRRGILAAILRLFWAIDLDLLITKADPHCRHHRAGEKCRGHVIGCHWHRPLEQDGFHDPLGLIDPHTPVNQMTLDEVLRLRAPDGFRIWLVEDLLRVCGRKIVAYLEPKDDPRFELDWPWIEIKAAARRYRVRVRVRSIKNLGGFKAGLRRVNAAKRTGVDPKAHTIH